MHMINYFNNINKDFYIPSISSYDDDEGSMSTILEYANVLSHVSNSSNADATFSVQ